MKYYLKINNYIFPNVTEFKTNESWRTEVTAQSIGGDLTIDRIGQPKVSFSCKMNGLSQIEMNKLRDAIGYGTENTIEFYLHNQLVQKQMRVNDFEIPNPLYYYGDRTKGVIYPSFDIVVEEV